MAHAITEKSDKNTIKKLGELTFKVFVISADQKSEITVKEAEEFQRRLKKKKWARSQALQEALAQVEADYKNLWKNYSRGKYSLDAESFTSECAELFKALPGEEVTHVQADLVQIANAIGRAGNGLFRKSGKTDLTEKLSLFLVDPSKQKAAIFLPEKEEANEEELATEEIYQFKKPASTAATDKEPLSAGAAPSPPIEPKKAIPEPSAPAAEAVPEKQPPAAKVSTEPHKPKTGGEKSPREFMPMAFVNLDEASVWTKGKINLEIIGIKEETHDVKTFRFVADPPAYFNYKPGQFLTLELEIEGKRVLRSYTISSSPIRSLFLEITVKRVKGGLVSNWLCDHAYVGQKITAKGPNGKFSCLFHPSEKLLFLSGGSGITPMMSMSRWISQTHSNCDIIFFHNAHTRKDIIFSDEIQFLEKTLPAFKSFVSLTRNPPEEPWNGLTGRIDLNMLEEIAPDFRQRRIFVCGPAGFMAKVKEILTLCGFDVQNQFHQESFGPAKKQTKSEATPEPGEVVSTTIAPAETSGPPKKVEPGGIHRFTSVHFSESQLEVFGGDMDLPLLEIAEEVGIEIPNSCRSGSCGSCKAIKLSGTVNQDSTEALTESEQEEGYVLTCVSYPEGYVELEV